MTKQQSVVKGVSWFDCCRVSPAGALFMGSRTCPPIATLLQFQGLCGLAPEVCSPGAHPRQVFVGARGAGLGRLGRSRVCLLVCISFKCASVWMGAEGGG